VILALLLILSIALSLLMLLKFQEYSSKNINNFNYVSKLSSKLNSLSRASILTFYPTFGLPGNVTQMIIEERAISQQLTNEMYQINPNLQSIPTGTAVQQQEATFDLLLNNYMINSSMDATKAVQSTRTPLINSYKDYYTDLLTTWNK
jgi:alanyl-tRNA synthetase